MILRKFNIKDKNEVEKIFSLYWTDPEFLKELSCALDLSIKTNPVFYVAEDNSEILGVVAFRTIPDYLRAFSKTNSPVELYIIAVKNQRRGIGKKLKLKLINEVRELGYTEILLFSPNSHSNSWKFYDLFGFERVGEVIPPEDDVGQVWQKIL